jgi:DNA-binding IclR family transcriptional regulator
VSAVSAQAPLGMVGSVTRAIEILSVLSTAPGGMELAAIARSSGMSPSGAHRTLRTLVQGGVAQQQDLRGTYRLGPRILVWARQMRSEAALAAAAEPELAAIAEATHESVLVSVMRERRIWTISEIDGRGPLVARPATAELSHFHDTARGKLFLAHLDEALARALIAASGLPRRTRHTITDEAELWRAVEKVRSTGYAVSREEHVVGGAGLALPILDGDRLVACVAMAVPMARFDRAREAQLVEVARRAARRIEASWNPMTEGP